MIDDNKILMPISITVVICPHLWHPEHPNDLFNDSATGFIATYMITFHPVGGLCDSDGCRSIEKLW